MEITTGFIPEVKKPKETEKEVKVEKTETEKEVKAATPKKEKD